MKVLLSCSLFLYSTVLLASDPTQPEIALENEGQQASVQDQIAELRLSLIRDVQGRQMALIDGKMLKQGDKVHNWVVQRIEPNRVVLRQGTEEKILQLFKVMGTND